MPKAIASLLDSSVFAFIARLVLLVTFIVPGITQITGFQGAIGEFAHFNLNPPAVFVVASFITLLVGSALVLVGGKRTWLGAGALAIYTGLTIFIVHHFWTMSGDAATSEMRTALEHISLIGGLMCVAVMERRRAS